MKKNLPLSRHVIAALILFSSLFKFSVAQTVIIDANSNQSANIVVGLSKYHVMENIYTDAEIGSTTFTTAGTAINHIDLNVYAVGTPTVVSNFNIYLKEVAVANTVFADGAYNTTGYTKVFSGSVDFNSLGWIGIDLNTPFIRTGSKNLQLLIERLDNSNHGTFRFNAATGNETSPSLFSSRRYNSDVLPVSGSTSLTGSNFRPRIKFRHIQPNDAAISQVYTLGKLPVPFANPHVVSVNVLNNGSNILTNLPVTLNVTGANSFTDTKTIATLLPAASTTISFSSFSPVAIGYNTVTVSIPADDFSADNVSTISQQITTNAYNYAYGSIPTGSTGFNVIATSNPAGTGDFAVLFTSSSAGAVNQVGINFASSGQPFTVCIWDKSGTGKPGTLLWESSTQTTTNGVFTLPISPAVAITDTFYIGLRQLNPVNIQFAYQSENPARFNTFFYAQPTGSTSWIDLGPNSTYKFMIEPRLTLANDVGIAKITNPAPVTNIDNCGIVPEAVVTNFGSQNQVTPFNVTYLIRQSGSTVYTDTKSISLSSGISQKLAFAPFAGAVSGADSSIIYTSLATDAATNNDTVVTRFNTNVYAYSDSTTNSGGYSYANSTICAIPSPNRPTYAWSNLATTEINWGANGDDDVYNSPMAIPFPFNFFGNTYNQFWVASNGWIGFTDPNTLTAAVQRTPAAIPVAGGIDNYIAGVLRDLDLTTSTYADAHTYYGGDATQMVVTYLHAHLKGSATDYITFQIILKVNGDILVQYDNAQSSVPVPTDITNFCSVGIENAGGTKGLQYRLNGSGGSMFGSPLAVLFVAPQAALPVSLQNFTAQRNGRINKVSWTTTQEINTSYFVIERSNNGRNFSAVGKVTAAGNSNRLLQYNFADNIPVKGINYYRLAITDVNGAVKYSAVKAIRNDGTADVSIYPMPVKGSVNLLINSDAADKGTVTITNLNGQLVQQQNITVASGQNKIVMNTNALSSGAYVMKIKLQADLIVKKFNKQ